jgi:hypothetical protein
MVFILSIMTNKLIKHLFIYTTILLIAFNCTIKKDVDTCISFKKGPVSKVEGPVTAMPNQEIVLTVFFTCFNGCGQFGSLNETTNGNTTTIVVNAKYEGCVCTQDVPTRTTPYKFKKTQQGVYTLKFYQSDSAFINHTIVVQ